MNIEYWTEQTLAFTHCFDATLVGENLTKWGPDRPIHLHLQATTYCKELTLSFKGKLLTGQCCVLVLSSHYSRGGDGGRDY